MKTTTETSTFDGSAMAVELAAIGEAELTADELALTGDELAPTGDDPDVATVATLVGIGTTDPASLPDLSPLALRRVWKRLEGRVAAAAFAPVVDEDPHAPAANDGRGWRSVVAGLAVAAGFLLVPRLVTPPPTAMPVAETDVSIELGPEARALLDTLGDHGATRARSMADAYAQRLGENGGNTP